MPRIVEVLGDFLHMNVVDDGSSIYDFMISKNPELKNFPMPVVAGKVGELKQGQIPTENDVEIVLRADWHQPLKKDDTVVLIAVLKPMGGGGDGGSGGVVQAVLGAVLLVVAAVMWWNPMGWAAFTGSMALSTGLLGASLLLGGVAGMMVNQPARMKNGQSNETSSPTYSINGSGNQARLLQPIPEGFGRIQIVPDVVASPYTTYEDNDQYMYAVYGIGRGSYEIHELKFAEATFWKNGSLSYESALIQDPGDIELEFIEPGNSVTLFPDNVESNPNVTQLQLHTQWSSEFKGWTGPFSSPPPGAKASRFQIDFLYPQGAGWYDEDGNLHGTDTACYVQYRPIDDYDNPLGDWVSADWYGGWWWGMTAMRRSHFIDLPMGRYEFRFMNPADRGPEQDNKIINDLYVDGLRAYLPGTLKYNQSCIAIKIKATNNLSQNASQELKCIYTRKLPIWDQATRTWSAPQPTRRFDAAIAAMCKAEWGGRLTDDRIDLDSLAYCQGKCFENGWNFDAYIDSEYSVLELITQACAPYRVFPRLIADKITFVYDEANRPIKHIFTPRDITRNSLQPSWAIHTQLTPDHMIVSYLDEDVNYARREVDCILPDSLAENGKYLQYPLGICNRKLAHDYGIYVAACNRFRRVSIDFGTESLSRILYVGDVISIQHPRLRAVGYGKVTDWNEQLRRVYVDTADCDFDPTTKRNLWAAFNKPDGSIWGPVRLSKYFNGYMQFNRADYDIVKKQQGIPFAWFDTGYASQPTTFALLSGKNIDRRFIIKDIKYEDLHHATISVMNDDPRVFSQVVPVPPWEYRNNSNMLTSLATPSKLTVKQFQLNGIVKMEWVSVFGASAYTIKYQDVHIEQEDPNDPDTITYEYGSENVISSVTNTFIDIPVENFLYDTLYAFMVRATNETGVSSWSQQVFLIPYPRVEEPEPEK